jgi:uncharacterized iron-regulated membrane protein
MAKTSTKLYSTLWRWHFYAGLFCIPLIISLSITGAIYLFKPQIDAWVDRDFQNLTVSDNRYSPLEQINAAKKIFPQASFVSYRIPENERQAIVITLREKGEKHLVYVNPYTLDILKTIAHDNQFIRIIRALHGEILLGDPGSFLIELAGCWAIVLIITATINTNQ